MANTTTEYILEEYEKLVGDRHPDLLHAWPILTGYSITSGSIGDYGIYAFKHTGVSGFISSNGIGEIAGAISGVTRINESTIEVARKNLTRHFRLQGHDGLVFLHQIFQGDDKFTVALPNGELEALLTQHEMVMGLSPMKIFLSHKSTDKPLVRDYAKTLESLGFDPWLDEDAMKAGDSRERALHKGLVDSCAAIFFVTENFADENYLASEIEYAIDEKRKKGDKFALITLRFNRRGKSGVVPDLLKGRFIFKEPETDLEALREILRALPIEVGSVRWRL